MTASVVLLFDLSFRRIKLFAFCYVFYLSCVCEGDFFNFGKNLIIYRKVTFGVGFEKLYSIVYMFLLMLMR
jgi:hypothetical protein